MTALCEGRRGIAFEAFQPSHGSPIVPDWIVEVPVMNHCLHLGRRAWARPRQVPIPKVWANANTLACSKQVHTIPYRSGTSNQAKHRAHGQAEQGLLSQWFGEKANERSKLPLPLRVQGCQSSCWGKLCPGENRKSASAKEL